MRYYIKLCLVNLLFFILFLEIACRTIPFLKNYSIVADYESTNSFYPTLKKMMIPGENFLLKQGNEFRYNIKINSIGLFDNEISNPEIIGLGDSFTQGFGAPIDSTYLKTIERKLNIITLNAGIGGSDPMKDLERLKFLFAKPIIPKVVIETVNTTDLFDIAMNKRGLYTDYLKFTKFLYRLIIMEDYKRLLYPKEKMYTKTHDRIFGSIIGMNKLCNDKGVKLVVCFQPIKNDIYDGWTYDSLIIKVKQQNVPVINLKKAFEIDGRITKNNVQDFYWQTDGHFNSKGYNIMGESIAKEIQKRNFLN